MFLALADDVFDRVTYLRIAEFLWTFLNMFVQRLLGVTVNASISTFLHRSKRVISFLIRMISYNQRKLFEFLGLIDEKCFLFQDDSILRKASPVDLRNSLIA